MTKTRDDIWVVRARKRINREKDGAPVIDLITIEHQNQREAYQYAEAQYANGYKVIIHRYSAERLEDWSRD